MIHVNQYGIGKWMILLTLSTCSVNAIPREYATAAGHAHAATQYRNSTAGDSNVHDTPQLIAYARKLLGVTYSYGATSPTKGFDCSGFVYYVFKNFGVDLPRSSAAMGEVGAQVALEEAQSGDIILFTGTNPAKRHIGHVGIVVDNVHGKALQFIHASSGKAYGVTETALEGNYKKRFMKVVRVL